MDTSAPTGSSDDLRDKLREGLRGLSPAYFGMAMATGIVSLSAHMQGWERLATTLFWINASLYGVLWLLLLLRIAWHPGAVRADLFTGWGNWGDAPYQLASRLKQPLQMWVLWPR